MGGIQLINPVFDCQLLRRSRCRLIVQAATAEREQSGLARKRKRVRVAFDEGATFRMAQEGNFFFRKLT
jgi:hypothetical protein